MRTATIAFLAVQSLAVAAWWLLLFLAPASRALFNAPGAPDSVLLAFFIPDSLILCLLGGVTARALAKNREWALTALAFHAGAALYATLYCLTLWLLGGSAWAAAAMSAYLVEGWLLWRLARV